MADATSIAPTGYQVAADGAPVRGKAAHAILGLLSRGLDAYVDIETARAVGSVPDSGDVARATGQYQPRTSAVSDIARNLTPVQWAGIAVAGVLAVGLARGWFR